MGSSSVVLATAGYDHTIRFWEATSGVCYRTLQYADSQVNKLEITVDKTQIAAAGNSQIRIFDVNSNDPQPISTYDGHSGNVTAVGFQKDSKWMYSGTRTRPACMHRWRFLLQASAASARACRCLRAYARAQGGRTARCACGTCGRPGASAPTRAAPPSTQWSCTPTRESSSRVRPPSLAELFSKRSLAVAGGGAASACVLPPAFAPLAPVRAQATRRGTSVCGT